mmetsp:Transcript_36688/g.67258  ORF Transcript_36688/g.67258 Transcript_36688/m.67258 type:complete len:277 (-) Transcript_36688:55-885(-)
MLSPADKKWIGDFAAEVAAGNSGKTTQLVNVLRRLNDIPVSVGRDSDWAQSIDRLIKDLAKEEKPVTRNRLLREWLSCRTSTVHEVWLPLGFPLPPESLGAGSAERNVPLRVSEPGVAIFDFDMTLTTRHVSAFEDVSDVTQVISRIMGGDARVQMLQEMLEMLTRRKIVIAVVSRNAKFVILKVLQTLGFDRFFSSELVFGFEQFDDETPKSAVVRERILPALGITEAGVLFIDDDRSNIQDMRTACPVATVLYAPQGGITQEQVSMIADWATNR